MMKTDPGKPPPHEEDEAGWSAAEIARRNVEQLGKPLSPVMKTAVTATELAHASAAHKARD